MYARMLNYLILFIRFSSTGPSAVNGTSLCATGTDSELLVRRLFSTQLRRPNASADGSDPHIPCCP